MKADIVVNDATSCVTVVYDQPGLGVRIDEVVVADDGAVSVTTPTGLRRRLGKLSTGMTDDARGCTRGVAVAMSGLVVADAYLINLVID